MAKRFLPILFLSVILVKPGSGQSPAPITTLGQSGVRMLRDSLKAYDEELELLQHFLEASTVDPTFVQHTQIRSWVLNNPILRDSLFYTLLQSDSSLQSEAGADPEILATPWDDLIQVRFGTAVFKGMTLKKALDKSPDKTLYRKLAASYRYSRILELRDPTFRLETPIQAQLLMEESLLDHFNPGGLPDVAGHRQGVGELSIDRLSVRIGPTWGGEIRLGVDEINNPFWANGTVSLLATYRRARFGIVLPLGGGKHNLEFFDPFLFRARRLTGARGFLGEIDLGSFGGMMSIRRFSANDLSAATNPNSFAFVAGIVNVYYSFGVGLNSSNFVRAKVGAGLHRVTPASVIVNSSDPTDLSVGLAQFTNVISPYVKVEYLNKDDAERFKIGLQFYNLTIMLTGSMDVIPGVLSLETKYVWPVGGRIEAWEYPEFFLLSPKLRVTF